LEQTKKKEVERLCEIATKTAEIQQLKSALDKATTQLSGLQAREQTHQSSTRRAVKVLRYLTLRSRPSRREEPAAAPAPTWNEGDDWGTLLARFRAALQKSPLAQGAAQDSSRAA